MSEPPERLRHDLGLVPNEIPTLIGDPRMGAVAAL
jgi:hypothetical protein